MFPFSNVLSTPERSILDFNFTLLQLLLFGGRKISPHISFIGQIIFYSVLESCQLILLSWIYNCDVCNRKKSTLVPRRIS